MGYRSQIVIGIGLALYNEKREEIDKMFHDIDKKTVGKDAVYFQYDSVKWYDSYPEVAQVNEFLHDNADNVGMVRVGEDIGDVETVGDPYKFDIYASTVIDFPQYPDTPAGNALFKGE